MKTNFTTATIAAVYLAISAQGQNILRFLNDTCEEEAIATMQTFDANSVTDTEAHDSKTLYIQGRDERAVCTDEDQIEVGFDNLAWVYEKDSSSEMSIFKPNYLGNSFKFQVNVSDVGCNCAAGVFLLAIGDECAQEEYESSSLTQCSTIEVMKANQLGFGTKSSPYEASSETVFCKSDILPSEMYGPGSDYTINTLEPYTVTTEFIPKKDSDLSLMKTQIYQNPNQDPLELLCYFTSIDEQLDKNMGMAISTYSLETDNNPFTDQCDKVCNSGSTIFSGLSWIEGLISPDNGGSDNGGGENGGVDNQTPDNGGSDNGGGENETPDNGGGNNQTPDNGGGDNKTPDNGGGDNGPPSGIEKEIFDFTNRLRTDPKSFIPIFEGYKSQFDGELWYRPGNRFPFWTREGVSAIDEAIYYLRSSETVPLSALTWNSKLALAAKYHTDEQGPSGDASGDVGYDSLDGSNFIERVEKFGRGRIYGQNNYYGVITAEEIVTFWFIDDGNRRRSHRRNLMGEHFRVTGSSTGPHRKYHVMTVVNYADSFD